MEADFSNSPKLDDLEIPDIPMFLNRQREFFKTGQTWEYEFRKKQLKILKKMVEENQDKIVEAIQLDLGRPVFEAYAVDVGLILTEVNYAIKKLKSWMKPQKNNAGLRAWLAHFKSKVTLEPIPRGVSLIVAAWNYPILLVLQPLIYSLAAGNTAIIKPSELSVHSSKLLDKLIHDYFDPAIVEVIPGGPETAQAMLKEKWDIIMFTGSPRIGKIYAKAAAENITPIILELGGKCPSIVDNTARIKVAAQRIAFGKFVNSSQTCVAPDYTIVHEEVKDEFIENLKTVMLEYYGDDPKSSPYFGRIINHGHFNRILGIMEEVKDKIILGGGSDEEEFYIEPTLVLDPPPDSRPMTEEIFGPILPILTYSEIEEIQLLVDHPERKEPLGMYVFSEDKEFINKIKRIIPSGDMCINDTALHFTVTGQKKGGIGQSGINSYGGISGFNSFSHFRTVYKKSSRINLPFIRPPYTKFKEKVIRFFLR